MYIKTNRLIGKTFAMIMGIKMSIERGDDCGVIGCKCPKFILKTLRELGLEASARPMIATQPLIAKFQMDGFEESIIDLEGGDKIQTGFIFYKT